MKVILLERLAGHGDLGDVVTVKDGFARNFLLPRRKAMRATAESLIHFRAQRAAIEMRAATALMTARAKAEQIRDLTVFLVEQATADGQLYGSVRPRAIARALAVQGVAVRSEEILQPLTIRALGRHVVKIQLHPDVIARVDLVVARSEAEFGDMGIADLTWDERRDRAIAILQALASDATALNDATESLVKVARFADDAAGERAWNAVRDDKSTDFEETVKSVLGLLEVNCLVSLKGDFDAYDTSLIHMQMAFRGALPTRLGNDRTFRLLSSEAIDRAQMDLSLYAVNAIPTGEVEREVFTANDGATAGVRLSQTLKRLDRHSGDEPLEVWAMAQVNGACVHRRVWTFA